MGFEVVGLIIGFILLIFGANGLVDGASMLAKKYNVSDLIIGLTIVAFGTSAPELVVNAVGAIEGHTDIVYGNVIGSNNFNLFIVLGIVGLILPIKVQDSTVWKEIPISLGAAILVFLLSIDLLSSDISYLTRMDAFILLLVFAGFVFYIFRQMKATGTENTDEFVIKSNGYIAIAIIGGLVGLILGGKWVVDNAILIATEWGMSEKIIGLTIIAAGTSLPELVTSVVAATKKNSDIAIGNVVGSNIFNLLLIISISGMITPLPYSLAFNMDFYLLIGGTVFLFIAMFTGGNKKLDRWEAFLLLAVYFTYIGIQIFKEL